MTHHAYLFEVRGIQRFLFASGKLRDMLAGSELLDYVCADNGLLDMTLDALGLGQPPAPRRAGATFYLLFGKQDEAERFRAAWRLAFAQWVPGVEWVDVLTSADGIQKAIRDGIKALSLRRNLLQADLPRPGPLSERSPRTGLAAVARDGSESLDTSTARLRHFQRPADSVTLEKRFLDDAGFHWPRNFEADGPMNQRFPLLRNRMVAVVHADGNGIGQVLRSLNLATEHADDETYLLVYRSFSEHLSRITQSAAVKASHTVLAPEANTHKVLPARPLVLGGDDMTILVRSDLAMDYTRVFLAAFEEESATAMQSLQAELEKRGLSEGAHHLPPRLTASAGICHIKCSSPFLAAYDLAESLCKRAKDEARRHTPDGDVAPAAVAFHKLEDAVADDIASLFRQSFHVSSPQGDYQLALPAYALGNVPGMPSLADLEALAEVFAGGAAVGINDRPLRELATLWHQDVGAAREAYKRWRQVTDRQQPSRLRDFDDTLQRLLPGPVQPELPASQGSPAQSPLSDLLQWLSLYPSKSSCEVSR